MARKKNKKNIASEVIEPIIEAEVVAQEEVATPAPSIDEVAPEKEEKKEEIREKSIEEKINEGRLKRLEIEKKWRKINRISADPQTAHFSLGLTSIL
jgi:hypothetical protein